MLDCFTSKIKTAYSYSQAFNLVFIS